MEKIKIKPIPYKILKNLKNINIALGENLMKSHNFSPRDFLSYLSGEDICTWIEKYRSCLLKSERNNNIKDIQIKTSDATVVYKAGDITIVIDPGQYFSRSFNDKVDAILITHGHKDHIDGLEEILNKNPRAKLIMTEITSNLLMLFQDIYGGDFRYHFSQRGVIVKEHSLINLGGINISIFSAGHTPGGVMYLLGYKEFNVLVTGDFALRSVGGLPGAIISKIPVDILICESTNINDYDLPTGFSASWHRELRFDLNKKGMLNIFEENLKKKKARSLILSGSLTESQEIYSLLCLMQQSSIFSSYMNNLEIYWTGLSYGISKIYHNILSKHSSIWQFEPLELKHSFPVENSITMCAGDDYSIEVSKEHFVNLAEEVEDALIFLSEKRNVKLNKETIPLNVYTHGSLGEILSLITQLNPSKVLFYHGSGLIEKTKNLISKLEIEIISEVN